MFHIANVNLVTIGGKETNFSQRNNREINIYSAYAYEKIFIYAISILINIDIVALFT